MKDFINCRWLLGALATVSVLAGCQREQANVNPNFNPETDEVNAQFVMSVSTGSSQTTKMSADAVQKNQNFLGIDNAVLLLYQTGVQSTTAYVKSSDGAKFMHRYDLGPAYSSGAITNTTGTNAASSSNRVLQLTLPLGADAALFYGKANNPNPGKAQGKMEFTHIDNDPAKTWFRSETIIGGDENVASYDATGRLMILAINTILGSNVTASASYTRNGYSNKEALPALSWKELGHQWEVNNDTENPYGRTGTKHDQVFLAESMGEAYALFTHVKGNEYRAGSSNAVKAMVQALYDVIQHTLDATSLNDEELNVQRLAFTAKSNMQKFFSIENDQENLDKNWTYLNVSDIKTNIVPSLKTQAEWDNTTTGYAQARDLNDYPYSTYHIPEGAAQLAFDSSNDTFSYLHPNKALVTPGTNFEPRKYVYPAELTYYVNSPLWVTAKANLSYGDFPNGTTNWNMDNETNGSKWKTGNWTLDKVTSDTRGVAIRDQIKYGVALMQTNVAWTTDAATNGLQDNRHAMTGESDRTIPVSEANIKLRGVLIGGVHPFFNWQFIPRALTEAEAAATITGSSTPRYGTFDGVIYDNSIPASAVSIPTSAPNYTLVFDNYDYSKADNATQNDVNVCLEFVNEGDAFWGRDNLIPTGGVFYLGAKLAAVPKKLEEGHTTEDQAITWPTDHEIPPIDESTGKSKKIPRVFIQGFLTKATFRIGENSLKYAYYTVPNLTSSQMSFGMSVDLDWESGYEYDLVFGE